MDVPRRRMDGTGSLTTAGCTVHKSVKTSAEWGDVWPPLTEQPGSVASQPFEEKRDTENRSMDEWNIQMQRDTELVGGQNTDVLS